MKHTCPTPAVAAAFAQFPADAQAGLHQLRDLILDEAAALPQIGTLQETLKWGQPSYLTPDKKAATTLRLGVPKTARFAIFAHCQSTVISTFAATFPGQDRIDGNRAVLFDTVNDINPDRLRLLIRHALTYHL